VFNFSNEQQDKAYEKTNELLRQSNLREEWIQRRNQKLLEKIDVTAWMVEFIERYVAGLDNTFSTKGKLQMTTVNASVIVPSYNSQSTIVQCLLALQNQETRFHYEIVVVDSSNDGTADLIASRFPSIRLYHLSQRTLPGTARNIGLREARGDVLAFTDADCVPESLWLEKMIREQVDGEYAAVGGSVLNALPFNPVAWGGYLLEFSERLPSFPKRFVDILPTCNVSFKRRIFERHGLFSDDLWPSEDHLFSWRLVEAGEPLLFNPVIQVRHIFRPQLRSFLQHQIRLGKASALARKRFKLPHAWLAEHPVRLLVPLIRLAIIEGRLARWDVKNFLRFNCLLPLCFGGLIAWGMGFCDDR
jgi:glycosyltransferase involved in cell wall biosynthesis